MPYLDRQNRICGFLDIEENETCGKFLRRYFILDTQANHLLWYMDNPQNLAIGAGAVGSLQLTYISKVSVATPKQKPKTPFCFVINALSQRYFLQASDQKDLQDWVEALNRASKITVPKGSSVPAATEITKPPVVSQAQERKPRVAYKTEIVGGVVVHTPISINQDGGEGTEVAAHPLLRRSQSYIPPSATKVPAGPPPLKSGFCVKQGNVRKSWKRRFFVLDEFSISYYKCEQDKEPLRSILLKDVCKTHECLVKSGDLLMRDNLFEIITSSRTFYIQTVPRTCTAGSAPSPQHCRRSKPAPGCPLSDPHSQPGPGVQQCPPGSGRRSGERCAEPRAAPHGSPGHPCRGQRVNSRLWVITQPRSPWQTRPRARPSRGPMAEPGLVPACGTARSRSSSRRNRSPSTWTMKASGPRTCEGH
ncbi:pleckstrin homology domain-containing family A member 2 isoform X2 [Malurus melanocephalus]|uniref:pleckstrin homology domain-containing family A member 2 isoform X2 n=1 Tax=Malurus melanocephalus TaxID=175006 RepID=UPI002546A90F|nr:pleckstrin homology domain-containing family A member 2 isoform X2 [Malurus melanocephalus]